MNNDYVEDYLMHHGVKGMKWGVINNKNQYFDPNSKRSIKKALKTSNRHEVLIKGEINNLDSKIYKLSKKDNPKYKNKLDKLNNEKTHLETNLKTIEKGKDVVIKYATKNGYKITSKEVKQNAMRCINSGLMFGILGASIEAVATKNYTTTGHKYKVKKSK